MVLQVTLRLRVVAVSLRSPHRLSVHYYGYSVRRLGPPHWQQGSSTSSRSSTAPVRSTSDNMPVLLHCEGSTASWCSSCQCENRQLQVQLEHMRRVCRYTLPTASHTMFLFISIFPPHDRHHLHVCVCISPTQLATPSPWAYIVTVTFLTKFLVPNGIEARQCEFNANFMCSPTCF